MLTPLGLLRRAVPLKYHLATNFSHSTSYCESKKTGLTHSIYISPCPFQCSHWEIIGCEFLPGNASEGQFCEVFWKMCIKCEVQKWQMWGLVYEIILETALPLQRERFVFPFKCACNIMNYGALVSRFSRFRQVCSIFGQFGLVGVCWTFAR